MKRSSHKVADKQVIRVHYIQQAKMMNLSRNFLILKLCQVTIKSIHKKDHNRYYLVKVKAWHPLQRTDSNNRFLPKSKRDQVIWYWSRCKKGTLDPHFLNHSKEPNLSNDKEENFPVHYQGKSLNLLLIQWTSLETFLGYWTKLR